MNFESIGGMFTDDTVTVELPDLYNIVKDYKEQFCQMVLFYALSYIIERYSFDFLIQIEFVKKLYTVLKTAIIPMNDVDIWF